MISCLFSFYSGTGTACSSWCIVEKCSSVVSSLKRVPTKTCHFIGSALQPQQKHVDNTNTCCIKSLEINTILHITHIWVNYKPSFLHRFKNVPEKVIRDTQTAALIQSVEAFPLQMLQSGLIGWISVIMLLGKVQLWCVQLILKHLRKQFEI